jgi:GTPase SAR1 family protein
VNFNIVHTHRSGPPRSYITMHYTDYVLDNLMVVLATATTLEPMGMTIIGDSGVGKSSIVSLFANEANREFKNNKAVIKVLTKNVRTLKGIYASLLTALGDMAPAKGDELEKLDRIKALLTHLHVQMIIFDDFHHVVEHRGKEAARAIVDEIKMIMEEYKVATVFVGIKSLAEVGLINEQIDTRYNAEVEIPSLNLKEVIGYNDFRAFVSSYIEHHEIEVDFDITSADNTYHLYAATRGILRFVVNFIKSAKLFADLEKSKVVQKKHFQRVVESAALRHLRGSKGKGKTSKDADIYSNPRVQPFISSTKLVKEAMGIIK